MMRPTRLTAAALVLAAGLFPATASACILNNQSSLSANGYAAQKNLDAGSADALGTIPFVFIRVFGSGSSIHFAENVSDLRKSLSSASLAHPFLWRWGDGTYSMARSPSHTYRSNGTYLLSVYAYSSREGGDAWAPFDRAQIRIVPPGEVWRDNLGEDALDVFSFVVTWAIRIVLGGVSAALAWGFLLEWRERRRERSTARPHPVSAVER